MKEKLEEQLAALIKNKVCIAFSAGVDSTVLLYACCEAAKKEGIPLDHIAAVTFSTVLHPQADLQEAKEITKQLHIRHEVLVVDELKNPKVIANGIDRCYHCKKELFSKALEFAKQNGYAAVLDGTNARRSQKLPPWDPGNPGTGCDQSAFRSGTDQARRFVLLPLRWGFPVRQSRQHPALRPESLIIHRWSRKLCRRLKQGKISCIGQDLQAAVCVSMGILLASRWNQKSWNN